MSQQYVNLLSKVAKENQYVEVNWDTWEHGIFTKTYTARVIIQQSQFHPRLNFTAWDDSIFGAQERAAKLALKTLQPEVL